MKLDKRRKYYLVLDCETATLPFASELNGFQKQQVAIAKPLIYDLGWQIIDRKGNVYSRKSFLISEIFSVPEIFNTAYYASKRPIYLERLKNNEIILTDWRTAKAELIEALDAVEAVGAYNSMFDFKKAIPFTELYINKLYSTGFYEWYDYQKQCVLNPIKSERQKTFEKDVFRFNGKTYPLFDLWGMSCESILNNDEYRQIALENNWVTESGKYYKTTAEMTYRYIKNEPLFDEEHIAINDAEIESEIFAEIMKPKKAKLNIGIVYFPFKILGTIPQSE